MSSNFYLAIILSTFFTPALTVVAQQPWFAQFGGDNYDRATAVARDADENIYLCGNFRSEIDADPGSSEFILDAGTYDNFYLIKLNPTGELIWAINIGNGAQDFVNRMVIDSHGDIYLSGTFQGEVDFDPGPGNFILETLGNPLLSSNAYIAKYSSDGEFLDAFHFRTVNENEHSGTFSLALDAGGNLIVGLTVDGSTDVDPLAGEFLLNPINDFGDIAVVKLTPNGELLWAHLFEGEIGDSAWGAAVDSENNIYCTGLIRSTVDFDPGLGEAIIAPQGSDTFNDIFVLSLTSEGAFRWVKGIGWDGAQGGRLIEIDESDNIYVVGNFDSAVNFNPGGVSDIMLTSSGSTDGFVMKMNTLGDVLWARSWGSVSTDIPHGMHINSDGTLSVATSYNALVDLSNELPGVQFTPQGEFDGLVLTWSADGELQSAFSMGTEGQDRASYAIKQDENYLVCGSFEEEIQLQSGNNTSILTAIDEEDAFLAFYDPLIPIGVSEVSNKDITIFPNPAHETLNIHFQHIGITGTVRLFDCTGKEIYAWQINANQTLNLSDVAPGVYVLHIETQHFQSGRKIVVR